MQLVSVWSDVYASTLALYTGRAGGHRWLVAAAPRHARACAAALGALPGKGEVLLLAHTHLTPLDAALRGQTDPALGRALSGVLVVDRALAGGPALEVPRLDVTTGDLTYREGGPLPAWQDALGVAGEQGACPAAGVCAALKVPVRVCAPPQIGETLQAWWATVPHALLSG